MGNKSFIYFSVFLFIYIEFKIKKNIAKNNWKNISKVKFKKLKCYIKVTVWTQSLVKKCLLYLSSQLSVTDFYFVIYFLVLMLLLVRHLSLTNLLLGKQQQQAA